MATTKKQTGLGIARSKQTFKMTWTKGETYEEQQLKWRYGSGDWHTISIKKDDKKAEHTYNPQNFNPYTAKIMETYKFQVRAKAKSDSWSAWQDKSFNVYPARTPTLTVEPSDSLENVTNVEWNAEETEHYPLEYVEYQTELTFNGAKPTWNVASTTKPASGTVTFDESSSSIANKSATRWVRVRSRGPAGDSPWVEGSRTYAQPNAASNLSAKVNVQGGGMQITVNWTQTSNAANPTESSEAQYLIAVPESGMQAPTTGWEKLATIGQSGGAASGFVASRLQDDECLWVRVVSAYQLKTVTSSPYLALKGSLATPEIVSVDKNDSTFRATVTATNNSSVPDSFLVVQYRPASSPANILTVGIIPHGQSSVQVQCPDWSGESAVEFGVYAVVGSYSSQSRPDGASSYSVSASMQSGTAWEGGSVPQAPTNVTVSQTDTNDTVKVTWDWSWSDATAAIIAWADREDAWESTDEPEQYEVNSLNAGSWNVSGLEPGKRWYIRVKLVSGSGDARTSSSWSEIVSIDLSSAPGRPSLKLSQLVSPVEGSFVASWAFISTDGTDQAYAEICEATISGGGIVYGDVIASTEFDQSITLYPAELGWTTGESHTLCVHVVSGSGRASDWSDPVSIMIVNPITIEITSSSLVDVVDEDETTHKELIAMPLNVTITGAGYGGMTSLVIERADDYTIDQPDEKDFAGFNGETIVAYTQIGESRIDIDLDDLNGQLNDGAPYNLIAIVQDVYGQYEALSIPFIVNWTHKALRPTGSAFIDGTIAVITPKVVSGTPTTGDTCDIYRLSADRPELVYRGAAFGGRYVDPYPAIGEFGGYRLVYKSFNGDSITADGELAWIDIQTNFNRIFNIINFSEGQIEFKYDVQHSNEWEKGFKQTKYLGGTIVGDWSKGVSRAASLSGSVVTAKDQDDMKLFRKLATRPGRCHVRTVDGSSFNCDIQVKEDRRYDKETIRGTYSLSVSEVDSDDLDGLTFDEWYGTEV